MCNECETSNFCNDIGRCLAKAIYDGLGETDVHDLNELAEEKESIKMPTMKSNIFEDPLSKEVSEIIKYSIL